MDFTEEESVPAESLFPIVTTRQHKKDRGTNVTATGFYD